MIGGLENILTMLIVILATLAALAGIVVLESFFRNKLKELFSDVNYFIFFFLIIGYLLYSIGEVSFYLARFILKEASSIGISDVYWSGGAIFILISFIMLAFILFKHNYNHAKFVTMMIIGGALLGFVLYLLFGVTLGKEAHFFNYFYPIISSLIVTFALSVVLFSSDLEHFGTALLFFFLASCGILLGDIFFTYTITKGVYGLAGLIADVSYLLGYGLSFVAFITLRLRMRTLAI
ncbi:MAG: hypothetical protein ABH824_02755 [Nanoarchaeota archaeon]|nr:hypothetical protein [Nanoarchaeota archaeon]MBU1632102.1 hypothetical protein [Nanoarchaeota archaeon]MBU1875736.1 hypothetical protein [Nanoarchaeota archaeon]